MLYLVPTPIGNLSDMTPRAIEALQSSDLILAEDTRVSKPLLKHFNINKPIQSYHAHNEHHLTQNIIDKLKQDMIISLVTDAGTPGISDPAFLLVRECRKEKIKVIALPGATAFVPALVASGLPADKFFFQGFLPQKKGRKTALQFIASIPCTIILYESPHRILKCLHELKQVFGGDKKCSASKEISKLFENHFTGTIDEVTLEISALTKIVGEWVICVEGN